MVAIGSVSLPFRLGPNGDALNLSVSRGRAIRTPGRSPRLPALLQPTEPQAAWLDAIQAVSASGGRFSCMPALDDAQFHSDAFATHRLGARSVVRRSLGRRT